MNVTKEEVEIYQKSLERLFPGQKAQSILTASRITASWLNQRALLEEFYRNEKWCTCPEGLGNLTSEQQCLRCRTRSLVTE